MTINRQKDSELAHLEKALNLLGFKHYSIIDKDGESPDFLIELAGETIGIEVTSIYRKLVNRNSAKTQSDIPVIVDDALEIYSKMGGIPLEFAFSFDGQSVTTNRKRTAQHLGTFLYEYVKHAFPKGIDTIQKIKIQESDEPLSLIRSVYIKPTDGAIAVGFSVSVFNSVQADGTIIEEALRKKEGLLSNYNKRCKKVWLLIVLPSMRLAADFSLEAKENMILNHNFDAAYILDDYRDLVIHISKS
jgi:hypothetical protein